MLFLSVQTLNNMAKFTHLTPEQRYKIDTLFNAPNRLNQKEIAQQVGISESVLSRELKRNSRPRAGYKAQQVEERIAVYYPKPLHIPPINGTFTRHDWYARR